ncbi:MAG: hypothetical protein ACXVXB_17375, partial [Nocardioidaceae bacterium]
MPLGVPVDLGREAARQAAREELSKQVYQQAEPSLSARVVRWLYEKLSGLLDQVAGVSPGGYVGLLVVVLLV